MLFILASDVLFDRLKSSRISSTFLFFVSYSAFTYISGP